MSEELYVCVACEREFLRRPSPWTCLCPECEEERRAECARPLNDDEEIPL